MVAPANFAQSDAGVLYMANGFQSVKRWDGTTTGIETAGVAKPPTAMTVATSGAGTITGTYTAYQRFVDRLGNFSNLSPISNTVTPVNAATVSYTNVPAPTSTQVTSRQILRNATGNTATYYVDVDTTDLVGTSFSSTRTDAQLTAQTPVTVANFITQYGVPPDDLPLLLNSKSRLLMSGEAIYSIGAVSLTNGSATVTGIGTNWTSALAGRYLYVAGNTGALISSVNTTAQTLTLSATWGGSTSAFSLYGIRSASSRRRLLAWSSSGLPEAIDVGNSANISRSASSADITTLVSLGSLVYPGEMTREHVFPFLQNPAPVASGGDGSIFPRAYRGCVNQRCVVIVESIAYMLDQIGIVSFDGNSVRSVSEPVDDLFDSAGYYDYRVNFANSQFFHGVHETQQALIRWFVSFDNRKYPHHCICFDYGLNRLWIEEYAMPITSSCNGLINGEDAVFLGSSGRRVFVLSKGEIEGVSPDAGTLAGTATSAGIQTLVDTNARFPLFPILGGLSVDIVSGTGAGQRRVISSNTATTLTVLMPWTTVPDTTSKYQIGGVQYQWKSGVFRYVPIEQQNQRAIEFLALPATTGTSAVRSYLNRSATPAKWGLSAVSQGITTTNASADGVFDLTKADGYWRLRLDGLRQPGMDGNRFLEVELAGVKGRDHMAFFTCDVEGVVQ